MLNRNQNKNKRKETYLLLGPYGQIKHITTKKWIIRIFRFIFLRRCWWTIEQIKKNSRSPFTLSKKRFVSFSAVICFAYSLVVLDLFLSFSLSLSGLVVRVCKIFFQHLKRPLINIGYTQKKLAKILQDHWTTWSDGISSRRIYNHNLSSNNHNKRMRPDNLYPWCVWVYITCELLHWTKHIHTLLSL